MANSINGAGASAGFVVSNSGAAPKNASRRRHALLGSSALIGIALSASPAMGQSISPAGGGTVSTNNGTITGGGANEGVAVQQNGPGGVDVTGVTITNTGNTPTPDGLRVTGAGGQGVGIGIVSTSTITSQNGDGVSLIGINENIGFGVSMGQTLNVTGINGLRLATTNGSLFLGGTGTVGDIVATARTAGTGTGVLIDLTGGGVGGSLGSVSASGFATGIGATGNGLGLTVEGGSITATSTGISLNSTSNIILDSQAAIVAPTGISATAANGVTVTTSGGGTINSTASGTGTGIIATSSTGTGNVVVNVGAAIGGTTAPLRGVDARTTGTSTGTVSVTNTAAITATGNAIYSASNATSGNVINVNADVSGGGLAVVQAVGQGYTVNVGAAATVTAAGATALLFETGDGVVVNAGALQKSGNGNGVIQFNQGGTVTNTGTIFTANGTASGITGDAGLTVTNSGSISAGNRGINTSGNHSFATSITNQSGGSITGAIGIFLGNGGTGTNTLDLQQGSTTGLIFSAAGGTTTTTLAGTLTGDYTVIGGAGANNFTLASTGSMQGATFGSAADTFTFNGGTINGVVNAGSGTDTFNSVLGAGNSGSVSLSNLTGFENYNHLSGTLTLSGSRASGPGWNVTSGASVTLSGSLNVTSGTGTAFSINGNTSGTVFEVLASGSISGFAGLFFNGGPSATLNNAGSISVTNVAVQTNGSTAITNSGTLASSGNVAIFTGVTVASLINSGTVSGGMNSFGVSSQFRAMTITNQAGGFITGGNGAILGGSSGQGGLLTISNASGAGISGPTAISTVGLAGLSLTNSGQVVGSTDAINATGTGAVTITNNVGGVIATGTLASASATFTAGGTGSAIVTSGSATVINNGTLYGNAYGFFATGSGSVLTLTNRGMITSGNLGDAVAATGTANVLNSGTISTTVFSAVNALGGGSIVNATGGVLTGGNDATFGEAVQFNSGTASFTNYGSASSAIGKGVFVNGAAATTINLHAGSTTGSIQTGSGNDTVALFNGRGTASTATVDGPSGITLQNAGTLAGATVGSIDLGGGTNTLALRGIGDGTAANGAIGILSVSSIAGLSVLNKLDSGTWNVTNGSFNYTGGTNVLGGRLVFVNRTAPSGTATISSGATLEFNLSGGTYFQDAATFNGAGTFVKSGTADFASRSLISLASGGLIDVQAGRLIGSSDGQGRFTGNLASLNIASGANFSTSEAMVQVDRLTGTGTVATDVSGNFIVGIDNGTATFGGTIINQNGTPGGKLVKAGTGTQTLTGANTYTGATTISGGTLAIGGTGTLGSSTITNNATFDIAGHTGGLSVLNLLGSGTTTLGANTLTITNASGTYSGAFTGTGGIVKQNTGTYSLTGTSSFSGGTTVSGGTLQAFTSALGTGNASVASGATLAFNQTVAGTFGGGISGAGAVNVTGTGPVTLSGPITLAGQLAVSGAGAQLIVSGARTGSTGPGVVLSGTNASLTVASTGSVTTTGGNNGVTVTGANTAVTNSGTIQSAGGDTVFQNGPGVLTVTNNLGGIIVATAHDALHNNGAGLTTVVNNGTIVGQLSGIVTAGAVDITNTGLIGAGTLANGSSGAFTANGTFVGIGAGLGGIIRNNGGSIQGGARSGITSDAALTVTNTGVISSSSAGSFDGITLTNGALTLTNTGVRDGMGNLIGGVISAVGGSGVAASAAGSTIVNSGSISGRIGIFSSSALSLTNNGTVTGTNVALSGVSTSSSSTVITNFNAISGGAQGILLNAGGTVYNYGSTSSILATNTAALTDASGIYANGNLTLINEGIINTASTGISYGVQVLGVSTITNMAGGTISGGIGAILLNGAGNVVNLNAGSTTTGDIVAAGTTGTNSYTIAGTLTGSLNAGSGADTVTFDTTAGSVSGNLVGGGGTDALVATGTGSATLAGTITGFESLTKNGTGTLTLTGTNTIAGPTTINAGTLALSGTGTLGTVADVTNNAAFDIAGLTAGLTIANLLGSGTTTLGANTLTLTNASGTYSGAITGTGGLIKQGVGTYTLSGTNTFTGNVLIEGGTLAYGANDVLADTVTVTVNAGTTFDLAGFRDTIGTLDLFGTLANGGLLTAATYNAYAGSTIGQAISSGTLNVLGDTALNAATAATPVNISAGTLTTAAAELLADTGAVLIAAGGRLALGGAETIGSLGDLSGTGGIIELAGFGLTVGGNDGSSTFSGTIQSNMAGGGLIKNGSGTFTLAGTNTGLDTIVINAGALSVASADNLGTTGAIGLLGGTLITTGSFGTDRSILTNMTTPGAGIDVATGTTFGVNGLLSGDGALTKSGLGTLDLLAANTGFSGDLFVNGGAIRAGNAQAFGTGTIHLVDPTLIYGATGTYANNILLEVQTPASADPSTLRAESGVIATISGSITHGTGAGVDPNQPLVIDGLGRIILTNSANAWAGTTTINVGATLEGTSSSISGSDVVANGLLLFSQPISGTFAKNVSGSSNVQVTGLGAGQTFTVGGALTNSNGLQVLDGSALAITGSVTTTGNFSAVTLNLNNMAGIISQLNNNGSISGVFALFARTNLDLTNSGSISSSVASFNSSGIFAGGNATVVNSGQITSGTNAISAQGTGNLTNSGLIRGGINASTIRFVGANSSLNNLASGVIATTGTGGGIFFDGANASVTNAGSISGGNAVQLAAGGTVANTGTLTSAGGSSVVFNATGAVDNQASGVIRGATNGVTFVAGTATVTNAGSITGSNGSGLRLLGGGTVTNAATGTITGTGNAAILVQGGALNLVNQGSLSGTTGIAVVTAGGFNNVIDLRSGSTTTGSVTTDTGADRLALDLGATVNGAIDGGAGIDSFIVTGAGTSTLGGNISNFESLAMNGSGTLTLGGVNSGFATVAVNSGTLNVTGGAAIDDLTAVAVASDATFGVLTSETVGTLALAGTLAGTGTLTAGQYQLTGATVNANLGAGVLTQLSGISTLNGTAAATSVAINGGTLSLGASNRLADAATVAVSTGATLNLGGNLDTVGILQLGGTLAGTGTLTASQYQLTTGLVNANLGAGTLFQLGGTSTLTGTAAASTVMVNAGTLTLGGNERLADTAAVQVASGVTFNLAGRTETIGSFGGMGTVALGAGRLVAGGSNADFGFGGNITGSGDLDKVGTGTFTLASNLAQTGRLNLNAGTTQFVGSTAGSVRVQGGTLTGSAAIAGNLTVASGTFSPGTATQPIAMFTAASFNASGGTLTFDLGGPATGFAADMINVSGAAVLSGGTVFTRPLEATANYRVSQNYVLLRSGSLTGTFANGATFAPTGTNPDLQWRLRYDLLPNAVVLELRKQIDFMTDLGPTASGNELAVAGALNGGAFMASDDWAGILNTISSQDPATRRATFNSISGEAISDISSATTIATSGFTDLLRQRLALGGGTSGNANLLSGLVGGKQALVALAASTPLDGAALPTDSAYASSTDDEKRGGVWLQGYGANGRIDGLTGQAGVDTFSAGVAGGIDARFGNVTVGGAFAVSQVETRVRARTSTNDGTLYQGGGYVAYDNGRLYGSVIGSYFSGDINSRRSVFVGGALFGVANGTAATRGYTGGAALGYRVPLSQSLLFTPQVSFTATGVTRDAFTETGAGGLSLQAARERREIYAATAEGRLSRPFNALGGTVEPYIGGGAVYSFGDLDTVSTNRFSGAPVGTGTFTIDGARLSPVTALVNGGINVRPSQNVRLGLQGEARLSQRQREERISLNLRIGF